ncbi:uncharacterized protein yc1106_02999 [Curvularia clavata]|uniref:Heme haloperoxidase family profile domain-containing protein n=1 Tax=Curvularia clavata TaxID=95742 RepID=A0A9Q8Z5W3_CURCL|nr:uncharacterized protein yc1106_02999 [Curvularia clavata]
MRVSSVPVVALAAVGLVSAQGSMEDWHPAGTGDVRGPCPGLNALANHNFLPHSGKNFTLDNVKYALKTAYNISEDVSLLLNSAALGTNPGGSTWGLDTLSKHNVLEHDGSLTRSDNALSGDSTTFNRTIYERTRSFWTAEDITFKMAANARLARMLDSLKANTKFSIAEQVVGFSHLETAVYMIVFGDRKTKTATKEHVEYFFGKFYIPQLYGLRCGWTGADDCAENERLPVELGWKTPDTVITGTDVREYQGLVVANTQYDPEIMGP